MPIHDLRCLECGNIEEYVFVEVGRYGQCPICEGRRTWVPAQIQTDMHEPTFYHATGEYHSNQREAKFRLAQQSREWADKTGMKFVEPIEAGDKVGGARVDLSLKESAFSYSGQGSRRSSEERVRSRERFQGATAAPPSPPPDSMDYSVSGVSPQRMTREQMQEARRSHKFTGSIKS